MEIHAEICCENLKKRDNLKYPQVDGRIILKCASKKQTRTAEGLL
jgi:hypothetical protein